MGFGFWVLGFGFWVLGFGFWVLGFGFRVLGSGFWVQGLRFRVSGLGDFQIGVPSLGVDYFMREPRTKTWTKGSRWATKKP